MTDSFTSSTSVDGSEEHLVETLMSQVDDEAITTIIGLQKKSLAQFEKTNEMLTNCCVLSASRLEKARKDLAENRQLILEMKSDLESIFRRIRTFKQNYITKYGDVYKHFGVNSIVMKKKMSRTGISISFESI
uniref:KxDL domain-containing protein n=1 Tax=Wuchereria bancrofti TaxID=6293 RepID=A0AAF5PSD8_WUCBA